MELISLATAAIELLMSYHNKREQLKSNVDVYVRAMLDMMHGSYNVMKRAKTFYDMVSIASDILLDEADHLIDQYDDVDDMIYKMGVNKYDAGVQSKNAESELRKMKSSIKSLEKQYKSIVNGTMWISNKELLNQKKSIQSSVSILRDNLQAFEYNITVAEGGLNISQILEKHDLLKNRHVVKTWVGAISVAEDVVETTEQLIIMHDYLIKLHGKLK